MTSSADDRKRYALNAGSSYGLRAMIALTVVVLVPVLFRRLGQGGFGTWSVMFTVVSVFTWLEVGFATGLAKFVPELRAGERREQLQTTLGATVLMMAGLGLIAFAICALMAVFGTGLAAAHQHRQYQIGLIVLGATMVLRFPTGAYGATLIGWQRYDLFNAAALMTALVFTLGAIGAALAGTGIVGVSVAYAAGLLSGGALAAVLLRRTAPGLSLRPRLADRSTRGEVLGFGTLNLLANGMLFAAQRTDAIIIAAIRGAVPAAPYAAAVRLRSGVQAATLPIVDPLLAMTSELRARGAMTTAIRRFMLTSRVALQITLPLAAALALFSKDLVRVWLGPTAPAITASIIAVLMTVEVVTCIVGPCRQVLAASGGVRFLGFFSLFDGTSNVLLTILLVSVYGAIGAAVASLVTGALLAPVLVPRACRSLGSSRADFMRQSLGPAIASSLPAIGAMVAIRVLVGAGLLRMLIGGGLGVALALAVACRQVGLRRGMGLLRGALKPSEPAPATRADGAAVPNPM